MFSFPSKANFAEMVENGVFHGLIGYENNNQDGTNVLFNFIFSNGSQTQQRDEGVREYFTHMMPEEVPKKIKRVDIYYEDDTSITGFVFYDKENKMMWKIGKTHSYLEV